MKILELAIEFEFYRQKNEIYPFVIFSKWKSVIKGDAAVKENNELVIANPHFCLNIEKAGKSLAKIKNLEAENYYCYHGGKFNSIIRG